MQTVILITAAVFTSYLILTYYSKQRIKKIPVVADNEKILLLSDTNFKHQLKNKVVLVDYWASWCAPCRVMAPVLNEVANELNGNVHIGKLNIELYQSIARDQKIRNIPTMVVYRDGKEINRFVGIKSKEFILKLLKNT